MCSEQQVWRFEGLRKNTSFYHEVEDIQKLPNLPSKSQVSTAGFLGHCYLRWWLFLKKERPATFFTSNKHGVQELTHFRSLLAIAPRWKNMQMALLEAFDPRADELWIIGATWLGMNSAAPPTSLGSWNGSHEMGGDQTWWKNVGLILRDFIYSAFVWVGVI